MDNSALEAPLYYTFSTVAQTLAAGFAILAAFLVFRLQNFHARTSTILKYFEQVAGVPRSQTARLVQEKGPAEFENWYAADCKLKGSNYNAQVIKAAANYWFWWNWQQKLHRQLSLALGVTVADIATCFLSIPFVHVFVSSSLCLIYSACALAVAAGIFALLLYTKLLLEILTDTGDEPHPEL